jgi:hypothetical protein
MKIQETSDRWSYCYVTLTVLYYVRNVYGVRGELCWFAVRRSALRAWWHPSSPRQYIYVIIYFRNNVYGTVGALWTTILSRFVTCDSFVYMRSVYIQNEVYRKFTWRQRSYAPIRVAARSKAWTVFARLNAGIVVSNSTQGMNVCLRLFCVCVVLCVGYGLATGRFPVQGVIPSVYRIKKLKRRPRSNKGL